MGPLTTDKGHSNTDVVFTSAANKTYVSDEATEWHVSGNSTHTVADAEELTLLAAYRAGVWTVVLSMIVIGTLVNGAVVFLLLRTRNFLSIRACLQFCLTGSSLLLSTTSCALYAVAVFTGRWPFSEVGCAWYAASFRFIGCVANYTLAAMAVERYTCYIVRDS